MLRAMSLLARSGGVQAARKARPMQACAIGTDVPMSGRVITALPLRLVSM